jgi:polyphosphate kinase 2
MASKPHYKAAMRQLQIALVDTQQWLIRDGRKLLVVLEGRDAAGKDGMIRRITEHLPPRNTRVVALPKPNDRQKSQWYFQRYAEPLPSAGEFVILNRSWYNRGGVEPVMGFCTAAEHEQFLRDAPEFERMLIEADIKVVKYWLDISKKEQAKRLKARQDDPLKALKTSPLDAEAQKRWKDYSKARDLMLTRTHTAISPWTCVLNDDKKTGRLNMIRHLLHEIGAPDVAVDKPDEEVVFRFTPDAVTDGRLRA